MEKIVHSRIKAVCDSVDVGGEMSFRLNHDKLLTVLAKKCLRIARKGFPRSVEEEFVRGTLARPAGAEIPPPKEEAGGEGEGEGEVGGKEEETIPQETITTTTTTDPPTLTSSSTTPPTTLSSLLPPKEIIHLHHLSLSLSLLTPYLPPSLPPLLQAHLSTLHDPSPLTNYLTTLSTLKSDLNFTRAGDYSLKPGGGLEDEFYGEAKRKRKREEEEEEKKRKKNVSGAVKRLGKVDTKGMMKMTNFFKKKE